MVTIETCCDGMKEMTQTGVLTPLTAFGHETGQMDVRTRDGTTRNYNEVKYCMFCSRAIRLLR